jgi:site-specific recombinase XerC
VSELVAIRMTDVDLDAGRIRITQGKGAKDRYVAFPARSTPGSHSPLCFWPLTVRPGKATGAGQGTTRSRSDEWLWQLVAVAVSAGVAGS